MIIFLLINLCLVLCGLVESTGDTGPPQQTLPGQQNVGSGSKEYSLNLSNVNPSIFTVDERLENDTRTLLYEVRDGYKVTSVVLGNTVWTAGGNDVLSSCVVHTLSGLVFVMLEVKAGESRKQEYFSGEGGRWYSIDEEKFRERLKNLQDINYLLEQRKGVLDLSGEKYSENVIVYRDTYNGVNLTHITVKSDVITVLDNGRPLWTSEESGERCSEVWIHSTATSTICRLNILHADNVIHPMYYSKNGLSWSRIDRHAYIQRHKAMLKSNSVRVDFANIDPCIFECIYYYDHGHIHIIGYPINGYNVSTITFCGMVVWKSKKGHCKGLSMSQNGSEYIFNLSIWDGTENSILSFTLLEKQTDSKTIPTLANACSTEEPTKTRINITGAVDPLQCTVYGYEFRNSTIYTYIPRPSIRVNFVFKDHLKLWEAGNQHDRCLKVEYTPCYNGSSFIHLLTSGPSGFRHWYLQAIGQNGSFNRITRDEYIARLGLQNDRQG